MIESGYYPIGEEYNPNAPYNQSNIEPIQLNVVISQSLSRPTTIEVTDYITNEWEDIGIDEGADVTLVLGHVLAEYVQIDDHQSVALVKV